MGHLGPKMVYSYNSRSAVRIVLQFCTMKGVKTDMEIVLIVVLRKSYSGQFGHFGSKIVRPHKCGSALRVFLILENKRGQEVYENFISRFSKKFSIGAI